MENGHFHFFASSFVAWRVAETKGELIELMNRLDHCGDGYRIYKVPLHVDAYYKISNYKPVVEGLEYVEERLRYQLPAN